MNAIQIKNITKRYKDVTALDDISFSFEFGRIYGFLGRNGAGKSTLINIIANRIFADQGEVLIDGIPAKENMGVHEKIFCMSEADLYDRDLKVKDLTSLDVVVAEEMKQLLRSLKQDRITIFSTHIMDLALDLCDEIVLLNHGELEVVEKTDLDSREFKDKIIAALREEGNE